jgi:nitrogenase molybdenum-iron protein NifN
MDIASSNFGEHAAIFGGEKNLMAGLTNVIRSYKPAVIGLATTCLSETIGDDVPGLLRKFRASGGAGEPLPHLIHTSTPAYTGSHAEGFTAAVRAIVKELAQGGEKDPKLVNIIPGMVSPADLRHLREIVQSFGLTPILLPDYSERLDGPSWAEYQEIPAGGTPIQDIRRMGRAAMTIEFTVDDSTDAKTAGTLLTEKFGVPRARLAAPIGIAASDALFALLEQISQAPTPTDLAGDRGRLVDSYIDAHKYIFDKRAVIYGEADLVAALAGFCGEIGIKPVLCATGGGAGSLAGPIKQILADKNQECTVREEIDFEDIADAATSAAPDILIGNSKGYKLSQHLDVPLVRVGLPIHDRIGGARLLHLGYRGTQQLFDRIVNTLLERAQNANEVGYTYL